MFGSGLIYQCPSKPSLRLCRQWSPPATTAAPRFSSGPPTMAGSSFTIPSSSGYALDSWRVRVIASNTITSALDGTGVTTHMPKVARAQ